MKHGLSFDLECYQAHQWRDFLGLRLEPSNAVEKVTHEVLDSLECYGAHATFFVVGTVARKFPTLLRRIAKEGHEVATHGDQHRDVRHLDDAGFRNELTRSRLSMEDIVGKAIVGHRAPMFSLTTDSHAAFRILRELGFLYDSSIFPFHGNRYGDPRAQIAIHRLENGIFEIPLTVIPTGRMRLPALGGGYLRIAPFSYTNWAMGMRERMGIPAITYFHPWEFTTEPLNPCLRDVMRCPISGLRLACFNLVRQPGRGLRMKTKLKRLLSQYSFVPLRNLLQSELVSQQCTGHPRVRQLHPVSTSYDVAIQPRCREDELSACNPA